jgi:predicted dehydrogenase
MQNHRSFLTRRSFIGSTGTAVASFMILPRHVVAGAGADSPNEKINIACIGVGGRGHDDLEGVKSQNIVGLCDVEERRLGKAAQEHPKAKTYRDFRKMLDELEKSIDAVVVGTPDHTHAVAAIGAIKRGKHVYCEKPLAHSIHEIRALMAAAREHKVVTQLGNQGHSFGSIRTFCEWIWDGAIGKVHTIHAVTSAINTHITQLSRLQEQHSVPPTLDWDLWLGPAQFRPYNPMYEPGSWRGWVPFGSGSIGDWVCHVVDPVFWALDLGAPTSIQAEAKGYDPVKDALTYPMGAKVTFEFPARGERGPVKLVWFDGTEKPPRPADMERDDKVTDTGAIVMGDKGTIMYGSHGAGGLRILPDAKMNAYKKPAQTIPRVKDHYYDWLQAIKNGTQAGSRFDYGGPLTEIAMLGIIGIRLLGQKLEWNSQQMRFTNVSEANNFLVPAFRRGWEL